MTRAFIAVNNYIIRGGLTMNTVAEYIKQNYRGAFITVWLVGDGIITGEVVDGVGDLIALKVGGVTIFINTRFIALFV
jgi:hypothetical protein